MQFEISPDLLKDWVVVVVDDEPDSLLVAQTLLEMCGAQVLTASDGQEGFDLIVKARPKFVISDLSMPVMSGWQMLHALQEKPATKEIPVIALTAHAMKGDRVRAMEVGFHNYLTKPLSPETFINDLLRLLIDVDDIQKLLGISQSGGANVTAQPVADSRS
jgi:two-component system cell cycle response regulator DivK